MGSSGLDRPVWRQVAVGRRAQAQGEVVKAFRERREPESSAELAGDDPCRQAPDQYGAPGVAIRDNAVAADHAGEHRVGLVLVRPDGDHRPGAIVLPTIDLESVADRDIGTGEWSSAGFDRPVATS